MIHDTLIVRQLEHTLKETDFAALGEPYRGKVRDVYKRPDRLVIVTTDRISAFDHVLGTIPWKGEMLNAIAVDGFERTKDLVPNHLISTPDPNVMVVKPARAYPLEFIVRGYITGSLWKDFAAGQLAPYGIQLPANLKKDERFKGGPMMTPFTKAEHGKHDEPISKEAIVAQGIMTAAELEEAEAAVMALYRRGSELAEKRGLILVDTKYELGRDADGTLIAIDELHTPDSSRYWLAESYVERFHRGESQQMLDKQNLREWLTARHGFSGHGIPPALDDEIRVSLTKVYATLYERLLGHPFNAAVGDPLPRIRTHLERAGMLPLRL